MQELPYCTWSLLVIRSFYRYQNICVCDLGLRWNWPLSGALFPKHILLLLYREFFNVVPFFFSLVYTLLPSKKILGSNMFLKKVKIFKFHKIRTNLWVQVGLLHLAHAPFLCLQIKRHNTCSKTEILDICNIYNNTATAFCFVFSCVERLEQSPLL